MAEVVVQDKERMLEKIQALPQQLRDAWVSLWTKELPWDGGGVDKVVVAGMGGSGVAGRFAKELFASESSLIFEVVSGYSLPKWVDSHTLVVAISYSGNTEETLNLAKEAAQAEAKLVVIASGGKLVDQAVETGYLAVDYRSQPRLAIGWLYGLLLVLLVKLKLVGLTEAKFMGAVEELEKVVREKSFLEKAENLAVSISNRLPIILAYPPLTSVAYRWQTDLNENAKTTSFASAMPEFCHNLLAGLEFPSPEKLALILLESKYAFSRDVARGKTLESFCRKKTLTFFPISVRSNCQLAEQLFYVYFGELLSYYLAGVNGVDPTPVNTIESFKKELTKL